MPSSPKPKTFTARRRFSSRGRWYNAGDPVTDRRTIARLAVHGDKYLSWTTKPAQAEPAAVDTAHTIKPSPKEDTE